MERTRVFDAVINEKNLSIFLAFVVSLIVAIVLLKTNEITFQKAEYPILNITIRIILGFMLLVPFILKKKEIIIYYFLLSYPFTMVSFSRFQYETIFAFIIVVTYWKEIINIIKSKQNIYTIPFFIIFICLIYTTKLAQYPKAAFEKVIFYISLGGIYFGLTAYINSERNLRLALKLLLAILVFSNFVSLWQFLFGINSVKFFYGAYHANINVHGFGRRIPSFFRDAQAAGQYFACMNIILLGLISTYFRESKFVKVLFISSTIALLLTISRAAIFSFIIGLVITQFFALPRRKFILFIFVVFLIMALGNFFYDKVLPPQMLERFSATEQEKSFDFRYSLWKRSLPIVVNRPFGIGLGGENLYYTGIRYGADFLYGVTRFAERRNEAQVENSYLTILYGLGIFGFFGFLYLLIKYFATGIKLFKGNANSYERSFSIYLVGAMAVWLISAFSSPQISVAQPMIIFVILLALTNSSKNIYLKSGDTFYEQCRQVN